MARQRIRSAAADPPRLPVVSPEGLVKLVAVASNITGALELDDEGNPVLVRSYARKGWEKLEDLYIREGRPDLWSTWQKHREAIETARREGLSIAGFPDKYLPREVQRRRAGHRPMSTLWVMPDLPEVSMDEPEVEEVEAPAPVKRGGRKSKVEVEPSED